MVSYDEWIAKAEYVTVTYMRQDIKNEYGRSKGEGVYTPTPSKKRNSRQKWGEIMNDIQRTMLEEKLWIWKLPKRKSQRKKSENAEVNIWFWAGGRGTSSIRSYAEEENTLWQWLQTRETKKKKKMEFHHRHSHRLLMYWVNKHVKSQHIIRRPTTNVYTAPPSTHPGRQHYQMTLHPKKDTLNKEEPGLIPSSIRLG